MPTAQCNYKKQFRNNCIFTRLIQHQKKIKQKAKKNQTLKNVTADQNIIFFVIFFFASSSQHMQSYSL